MLRIVRGVAATAGPSGVRAMTSTMASSGLCGVPVSERVGGERVTPGAMQIRPRDLLLSWGKLLCGKTPLLSIEVTRECPLNCPGCYAYADGHAGIGKNIRGMTEFHGDDLVSRLLALIERHDPIHVSLVGGEPLLRHRELSRVLPVLSARGRVSLVVTSGILPIPCDWTRLPRVTVCVSVDGLPATTTSAGIRPPTTAFSGTSTDAVSVCTGPSFGRRSNNQATWRSTSPSGTGGGKWNRILVSLYSPQRGEKTARCCRRGRREVAARLHILSQTYTKLIAPQCLTDAFITPPRNAGSCTYALVSRNYTADLATTVEPCVLGGAADCSQCGCAVSAALNGVAGWNCWAAEGTATDSSINLDCLPRHAHPSFTRPARIALGRS